VKKTAQRPTKRSKRGVRRKCCHSIGEGHVVERLRGRASKLENEKGVIRKISRGKAPQEGGGCARSYSGSLWEEAFIREMTGEERWVRGGRGSG